jgi:hypothetical protein
MEISRNHLINCDYIDILRFQSKLRDFQIMRGIILIEVRL